MSESRPSFFHQATGAERNPRSDDAPRNAQVLWQSACRAFGIGDLDSAIDTLACAVLVAHAQRDPFEATLVDAVSLARHWRELAVQRERHRRALESDEREMLSVKGQIESLVDAQIVPSQNLLARIIAIAGNRTLVADPILSIAAPEETGEQQYVVHPGAEQRIRAADAAAAEAPQLAVTAALVPRKPRVAAHLLGALRITLDDKAIERCTSSRARSVFAYLVTHRDAPISRDQLMDQFWRDADPGDARNSLNVALHSFRRVCKAVSDVPFIEHIDGFYRLSEGLEVWTDIDAFLSLVERGQRLEAMNQGKSALASFEQALALYQGDFLADCPYEDWAALMRDKLRLLQLDVLDRSSVIHLARGQYGACIALCQLILARDNCREDAHCRLMIAYARQDQRHLAVRQYQVCVEVLRKELNVSPNQKTSALCERIRRHEWV